VAPSRRLKDRKIHHKDTKISNIPGSAAAFFGFFVRLCGEFLSRFDTNVPFRVSKAFLQLRPGVGLSQPVLFARLP
jgi:hypothetical protein